MTTADAGGTQAGPFTRPGFIASALVVALVAVLGLTVGILTAARDDAVPPGAGPTQESALRRPGPDRRDPHGRPG